MFGGNGMGQVTTASRLIPGCPGGTCIDGSGPGGGFTTNRPGVIIQDGTPSPPPSLFRFPGDMASALLPNLVNTPEKVMLVSIATWAGLAYLLFFRGRGGNR